MPHRQATSHLGFFVLQVLSSSLKDGDEPTTIGGGKLKISVSGGVKVNDVTVKRADVKATNGVVHVMDKVLMP